MGHAYNESYGSFRKMKINFCNKLFTTWDFNITDNETSKLRKEYNKTNFQVSNYSIPSLEIIIIMFYVFIINIII